MARFSKPLIGFDGVHLKEEMNIQGVYLVATVKDYNNHIVPFGLALVSKENYDNWEWFLRIVKEATGFEKITIFPDRQIGLLPAIAYVLPRAGHRFCLRHIMDDIGTKCGKLFEEDRIWVCRMARSDSESDYKLFRSELAVNHPAASAYLDELERCHWVKYAFNEKFQLPTFDEITSNLSEQANNWMGTELRSAKPLDGFNCYFIKLSELMSEKHQLAGNWIKKSEEEGLVPKLLKTRNDRTVAAGMCNFTPLMEGLTACSNSARLQFLDMFIHIEL